MKMVEQNRRRCLFWTLTFIIYICFGIYCVCTNFGNTIGQILLSPFIIASLPLYGYGLLGVFIWAMMSMAFDDYKKLK